jgi:lysophospholipase L1-like esterase
MKRISLICFAICTGFTIILFLGGFAYATDTDATWLSGQAPTITKTGDLPDNVIPFSASRDCGDMCYGTTSAGQYVNDQFNDGQNGWNPTNQLFLYPGPSVIFGSRDLTRYSIFRDITPQSVTFVKTYNRGNMYSITLGPSDMKFTSERTGEEMTNVGVSGAAFSNNGKWMAMYVTDPYSPGSIAIFNTTDFKGKVIASNIPLRWENNGGNLTPGVSNFAVSDDGRYVADGFTQQNATNGNMEFGLRIYDTTTCSDQYGVSGTRAYCTYKNVWTGKVSGVTKIGAGIQEQMTGNPERPLNVRFKDNNTITFSAIHDYVSYTNFKVSTYEATIKPKPEPIKLLALGDSYISGEGAYSYRDGTDTSNNKCHQSTLSYPYLLGAKYAAEYHSVACSGAVMDDLFPDDENLYSGQVDDKKHWYDRDQEKILNSYIPGYAGQSLFIDPTKPNTILLSIGGNDINFSNIVKRCVISFAWDPCYHKQSERKSLLLTIYSKFSALKATYTKILSESPSGTRLYVVGYPQVINPTGNCGVNVHFDDSEKQFASLLIERLNETIKAAAESSGAVYVDISDALAGHRLCNAHDDGVNGLTSGDDSLSIGFLLGSKSHSFGIGNESYHPTALGHQLISNAIAQKTENLTKQSEGAVNVLLPKLQDDDEFITTGAVDDLKARRLEQQDIISATIVSVGDKVTLDLNADTDLQQNSPYQVVFHSEELAVAKGTLPLSGNLHLDIVVPKLSPGIHSVHVYAKDTNGEDVDIVEDVYVVASHDDFDGDGIKNDEDNLPFINETGKIIVPELPSSSTHEDEDKETERPSQNAASIIQTTIAATNTLLTSASGQTDVPHDTAVLGMNDAISPVAIIPQKAVREVGRVTVKKNKDSRNYKVIIILTVIIAGLAVYLYKRSKKESDKI